MDTYEAAYETHTMADPRLPFIFHNTLLPAGRRMSGHNWHENIEIISILSGKGYVALEGNAFAVGEGDVFVIGPNRLHGFFTDTCAMRYFCLIIDRSFFLDNHFDSNSFLFDRIIRDEKVFETLLRFGEYWGEKDGNLPLRVQKLRLLALSAITDICDKYAERNVATAAEPRMMSCIKQAIGYVRAKFYKDISLDGIAEFVGVSKYYFAREFKRVTGYSFVSYLNMVRCEKAKELLIKEEYSIREVGNMCGFFNHSYFTRTFLGHTGLTPTEYRKERRKIDR